MYKPNNSGVTIIELMTAMAMTAIIVGIIAAVWINFNRHVIEQRRKSVLHMEIRQILASITSQLRRSPAVLAWHTNGITYVSPNNGDTIVYEFYADELLKNDVPLTLISQDASISDFSIGESEATSEDKEIRLLAISIAMQDDFDNQVAVSAQVAAKVVDQYKEEEEGLNGWNF